MILNGKVKFVPLAVVWLQQCDQKCDNFMKLGFSLNEGITTISSLFFSTAWRGKIIIVIQASSCFGVLKMAAVDVNKKTHR